MSDKQYTHHDDQTHLETALRRAKPWFETNATFLIYGLAAVLAIAAVVVWLQRQPEANSEVSAMLMEARTPEDFQSIADGYSGTDLGKLARLRQAESLLNSATSKLFKDKDAAQLELEQADAALKRLGDAGLADPTINERVLIGKARLAELRCDGSDESIKAAIAAWQQILDQNEGAMVKALAEERIARLQQPSANEFYAWFHTLEPQPTDDLTMPGLPGGFGGPGTSVPDVPNVPGGLTLPSLPEINLDDPAAESDPTESDDSADSSADPAESVSEEPDTETDEAPAEDSTAEDAPVEEAAAEEAAGDEASSEASEESGSETDPDE